MGKVMGEYCKAYYLKDMRKFKDWKENSKNARDDKKEVDGKEIKEKRILTDESIVYLQENYVVTDDVYKEENILFDKVTPAWEEFCKNELNFVIPDYALPDKVDVTKNQKSTQN